nr:hypothetical protein [Tanacetum cinerariifolium]
MALISLSFKKIYKPTNNNLRTSSNTSRVNQDNSPRIHRNVGYESQRSGNVAGARETVGSSMEEAGIQLNAEQADWKDDTDDEFDDQELEAHYMYMAKIQEVSPDAVDSGPIFDTEPEQKVKNDDHYDVFAIEFEKLKSELEDFRNKNKSLTEANNKMSKENDLLYADFQKSKAELKRHDSIDYATEMELECAKVKAEFYTYKKESQMSCV